MKEMSERMLLPLVYRPGHVFYDIHVRIEDVDTLKRLIDVIRDCGMEIVDVHLTRLLEKGDAFILIDITKSRLSLNELHEKLRAVSGLGDIEIREVPLKGYGFHVLLYPPQIGPFGVAMMINSFLSTLLNAIKNKWGSAGEVTLYRMGEMVGEDIYRIIRGTYKAVGREFINIMNIIFRLMGWIEKLEILEYKDENVVIKVYDGIECRYIKSENPNSQFFRGVLLGIFKQLLKNDVKVVEDKCIARGDEYCQFKITVRK